MSPVIRLLLSIVCSLSLPVMAAAGQTMNFSGGPEDTRWALSGNVFECRFEQLVPGYGRAVFMHQAGEDVVFQLETDRNLMAYSKADVSITPPGGKRAQRSEILGTAKNSNTDPNLTLDSERTNRFLHALLEGRLPTISHHTYYDSNKYIQVQVSATHFTDAYQDYISCTEQLLRFNFGQVSRSKVFFNSGEDNIDKTDTAVLDKIIYYIKNDPRVFAVYLDGHSDNRGRRYDNRQMSKRRVEAVERYFLINGISPDIVTTRFHGDRYPVANNGTANGRAANRRVTIRLEMKEDMPLPENMVFQLPPDASVAPTLDMPVTNR